MTTERLEILIKAIPIVLGASLITITPVRASEQADHAQTSGSDLTVAEGIRVASPLEKHSGIYPADESDLVLNGAIASDLKLNLTSEKPAFPADAVLTDVLADASTIDSETEVPNSTDEFPDEATDSVEVPTSGAEPTDEASESVSGVTLLDLAFMG